MKISVEEYLKIARAVARTFQKVFKNESEDIESVATLEAVRCFNLGLSTPITVVSVRRRVIKYVNKFTASLPVDNKPLVKDQLKMFTTISDKDLDRLWEFAYSGKKIPPKELRGLIEKFKAETCFIS